MLRRQPLSLPYPDQVPSLARLIELQGPVDPTDSARLVDAAIYHGVAGHVQRALAAGCLTLATCDVQRLGEFHRQTVLQTAVLRRELSVIVEPLEHSCQAPSLLIKGPGLAQRFYPDWRLRPSADLDLLVPKARLEPACRCLEGLGYERLLEFRPGYAECHGHDVHLRRRLGRRWWADVELHWRVGDDPASAVLSHERLRIDSQTLEIDDTRVAVPTAGAQLIVVAVHLLSDRAKRLAWVNDLVLVARSLNEEQWDETFGLAETWGLLWPLHRALDYGERHLGCQRPRPRPTGAPPAWGPLRAVEDLNVRAAPHLGRLAALGWRDRVAFLRAVLLPTRQGLRGTVGAENDAATTWQLVRRHTRKALAGLGPPSRR
jgi:putative nucleotidyltransferase-like protein